MLQTQSYRYRSLFACSATHCLVTAAWCFDFNLKYFSGSAVYCSKRIEQVKELMLAPFLPFTPQSVKGWRLQDGDTCTSSVTVILTTGMRNCSQTSSYFFLYTHKKNALRSSLLGISDESEPLRASTLFSTTAGESPFSTPVLTGLGMRPWRIFRYPRLSL